MKRTFADRVRDVVRNIPRGEVLTYAEVAAAAGSPGAARAVGNIMKGNHDPEVPCHRVVRSDLPAPRPGIFIVYVILCENGAMYIGQTQNLQQRWRQHQKGTAADYTKRHKPKRIIHFERFSARDRAVEREKHLKTGFGRKWLQREWKAGRTRQAGGTPGGYNRGVEEKVRKLRAEGVSV